jgi:hypothetical protein
VPQRRCSGKDTTQFPCSFTSFTLLSPPYFLERSSANLPLSYIWERNSHYFAGPPWSTVPHCRNPQLSSPPGHSRRKRLFSSPIPCAQSTGLVFAHYLVGSVAFQRFFGSQKVCVCCTACRLSSTVASSSSY